MCDMHIIVVSFPAMTHYCLVYFKWRCLCVIFTKLSSSSAA